MECEQLLMKSEKLVAVLQKLCFHCLAKGINNLLLSFLGEEMWPRSVFKEEINLHKCVLHKKGIGV